jgi:hypothetical protein
MATKHKEIVRLLLEGMSQRDICCAMRCSRHVAPAAAKMVKATGISKEALAELTEQDVRQLLSPVEQRETAYVQPDLERITSELKRPGVTRKLLWYEYGNTTVGDGQKLYSYQQFCKLVDRHLLITKATMRLSH